MHSRTVVNDRQMVVVAGHKDRRVTNRLLARHLVLPPRQLFRLWGSSLAGQMPVRETNIHTRTIENE
jgi:hypothetical protein